MRPRVQSLSANAARPNIAARRQAPALFLGLSLAGFAAACSVATAQAGDTGTAPAAPLRCEIALDGRAGRHPHRRPRDQRDRRVGHL